MAVSKARGPFDEKEAGGDDRVHKLSARASRENRTGALAVRGFEDPSGLRTRR